MYKIPLFDLNFDKRERDAVTRVIKSGWISEGSVCRSFEKKFSSMLGTRYALCLSNCTSALHLALLVLGVKNKDEVICPSLTFVATVNAIRYINAKPVFCDIKSIEEPVIDPEEIEKKITKKTKAIIIMHYAGFPCDVERIMQTARRYNLKVIEDACHAPLSEYKGKKLGTIGDIGCFSFFSNKNISTAEGGMLVTNNINCFEKAKSLHSHGMTSISFDRAKGHAASYDVVDLGYNYRMDDIRASIGIVQLDKLIRDIKQRAIIRKIYIYELCGNNSIIIPFCYHRGISSNYIFTIVLKNSTRIKRDILRKKLAEVGIQTSIHYPAVHKFSIYKKYSSKLCLTEYYSKNTITLPMYSKLKKHQVKYIADILNNFTATLKK